MLEVFAIFGEDQPEHVARKVRVGRVRGQAVNDGRVLRLRRVHSWCCVHFWLIIENQMLWEMMAIFDALFPRWHELSRSYGVYECMTMEHIMNLTEDIYAYDSNGKHCILGVEKVGDYQKVCIGYAGGYKEFSMDEFVNHVGRFYIATTYEGVQYHCMGHTIADKELIRQKIVARTRAVYDIHAWVGLPAELHAHADENYMSWMVFTEHIIPGYQYIEGSSHVPSLFQDLVPKLRVWMREPLHRMYVLYILHLRRVVHKDVAPVIVRMAFRMRYVC